MATVLYPDSTWVYVYNDLPESSEDYVVEGTTIVDYDDNNTRLKITVKDFSASDSLSMYYRNDDGISITDDNMVILNLKTTSPPSEFSTFAVFMEDCNGVRVKYNLDNDMVGKEQIILTKAIIAENKHFNPSYVVKLGVTVSGAQVVRDLSLLLFDMHTVYRIQPTYAQPDEIIEFLGMVDNRGNLFQLTDTSVPSYNAIAKRIVEAEEFMEGACRQAWAEKRIVGEIRNADVTWASSYGYLGILTAESTNYGTQMFFKGIPVKLTRDRISTIDYSKGDKVEVRRYGSEWFTVPQDMIWCDEAKGIIYVKTMFFQKDASVRVTYRYGKGPCPSDIKQAVILKTSMIIVGTDWYRQRFPQSPNFDPLKMETLNQWTWQIKDIIRNHTDIISCGCI